jgi:Fe-S cluster assembly iron-binding protein IscA
MLTITPTAATILTKARKEKGAPADYGVRFYATTTEESSERARLAFKFVPTPGADDTIIDETEIDAYVAPEVDELIGDVVIDARDHDGQMDLVAKRASKQD